MLSQVRPAAGQAVALLRCMSTTLQPQGAPTYTYTPPGSSVQDPAYAGGSASEAHGHAMTEPKLMRPSKKAQWLRLTTRKTGGGTPLESQQSAQGAMLPPGCSMSDPHYSVRDPVYFRDAK